MEKTKRYGIFLAGLFISSYGVSLVTKASMGTSPISAIPYVLSLQYPLTLGNFTILFSLLLILLQVFILKKDFKMEHLLQIPISIAFVYFIDITMVSLKWFHPEQYGIKVISLLIGCLILGAGVYLEVLAIVLSLLLSGTLSGVREGTIIAALLVGFIAKQIGKYGINLETIIFPEPNEVSEI